MTDSFLTMGPLTAANDAAQAQEDENRLAGNPPKALEVDPAGQLPNPEGYTPVGEAVMATPVEEAPGGRVPAVAVGTELPTTDAGGGLDVLGGGGAAALLATPAVPAALTELAALTRPEAGAAAAGPAPTSELPTQPPAEPPTEPPTEPPIPIEGRWKIDQTPQSGDKTGGDTIWENPTKGQKPDALFDVSFNHGSYKLAEGQQIQVFLDVHEQSNDATLTTADPDDWTFAVTSKDPGLELLLSQETHLVDEQALDGLADGAGEDSGLPEAAFEQDDGVDTSLLMDLPLDAVFHGAEGADDGRG